MLRRSVTAPGTNEAVDLEIWERNPVDLGFRGFYMVSWPAGIPFWALWRLISAGGQIWLKFLTGIGFFSAPTVKDDISEISVKFRRNLNPCSPQLQKRKAS